MKTQLLYEFFPTGLVEQKAQVVLSTTFVHHASVVTANSLENKPFTFFADKPHTIYAYTEQGVVLTGMPDYTDPTCVIPFDFVKEIHFVPKGKNAFALN